MVREPLTSFERDLKYGPLSPDVVHTGHMVDSEVEALFFHGKDFSEDILESFCELSKGFPVLIGDLK